MRVTVEELQNNFDYYLEKSIEEDIEIIDNHQILAILTNPKEYEELKKKIQ